MKFKAVIFDLDGTLLDSLADIGSAMNQVLERHGYTCHPLQAYKRFVGDGAEVLVRRALQPGEFSEEQIKEYILGFKQAYEQGWNVHTRCYPGIAELLDKLAERGIPAAVVSNKPHDFALRCREAFLHRWRFAAVLGQDCGRPCKPDPAGAREAARLLHVGPHEICYLGDTDTDMQTAVAAGMLPVGVLWGFRPAAELLASGARYLIEKPADLLTILDT